MNLSLYVSLDLGNPMVCWEVAIGRLRSVCDKPKSEGCISLWQYSLLKRYAEKGLHSRFIDELRLEEVRLNHYSNQVSRMSGLFFFEDEETSGVAVNRWKLSNNNRVTEGVNISASKISKLDSEWITQCLGNESGSDWMHSYWRGEVYGIKPLTEILVSGIGVIESGTIREKAYRWFYNKEPSITSLLSASMICFYYGVEDAGECAPMIFRNENGIKGSFVIKTKSILNADVPSLRERFKSEGFSVPIHPLGDVMKMPDMGGFDIRFEDSEIINIFENIHK
ncbi:hypothetical protein [Asticcacaulis sp. AND118]|uniref:hypothetical protein n=1 Tax=Asticcacaulis sp. AND118 TaxID=2840468 RepID=UPI001CFF9DCB|nr:hypothetical protein [Asticcacaulis sp. AND118]UDF04369.1 hypothetical protein LH365_04830 [Asticcacaulis sp. AND118]